MLSRSLQKLLHIPAHKQFDIVNARPNMLLNENNNYVSKDGRYNSCFGQHLRHPRVSCNTSYGVPSNTRVKMAISQDVPFVAEHQGQKC